MIKMYTYRPAILFIDQYIMDTNIPDDFCLELNKNNKQKSHPVNSLRHCHRMLFLYHLNSVLEVYNTNLVRFVWTVIERLLQNVIRLRNILSQVEICQIAPTNLEK